MTLRFMRGIGVAGFGGARHVEARQGTAGVCPDPTEES